MHSLLNARWSYYSLAHILQNIIILPEFLIKNIYWLSVKQYIDFKISLTTSEFNNDETLDYLSDLLSISYILQNLSSSIQQL